MIFFFSFFINFIESIFVITSKITVILTFCFHKSFSNLKSLTILKIQQLLILAIIFNYELLAYNVYFTIFFVSFSTSS